MCASGRPLPPSSDSFRKRDTFLLHFPTRTFSNPQERYFNTEGVSVPPPLFFLVKVRLRFVLDGVETADLSGPGPVPGGPRVGREGLVSAGRGGRGGAGWVSTTGGERRGESTTSE